MKVLMISGDKNMLVQRSEAHARLELQKNQVEQLDIFVWPQVNSAREICEAAEKNKYDVITAQDPFWRGLLAWRVARRTGAKLNLQVHTDLSAQPFLRRRLASFILRKADSVRVVSEKIREQVQGLRCKGLVYVLPIYLNISRFRGLVPKPHLQKTILWIGRFELEKDPLYAVQILKEVRAKGVDAKLIMLGSGSL
jgi:glycosyltransferase involved in cell wall biosynthesis